MPIEKQKVENRKNKVKRERYKGLEIVTDIEDRQRKPNRQIVSILKEKSELGRKINIQH